MLLLQFENVPVLKQTSVIGSSPSAPTVQWLLLLSSWRWSLTLDQLRSIPCRKAQRKGTLKFLGEFTGRVENVQLAVPQVQMMGSSRDVECYQWGAQGLTHLKKQSDALKAQTSLKSIHVPETLTPPLDHGSRSPLEKIMLLAVERSEHTRAHQKQNTGKVANFNYDFF